MGTQVTIGQFEYTLDSKNRVVIPPCFREQLIRERGTHFFLSIGLDGCIWLFLPSQWETFLGDMKEGSKEITDKSKARALRRYLYSSAVEAPLDDQGRLLIPQELKDHADLKKEVLIAGAGDKAEIWDRRRRKAYTKEKAAPAFEELAKDMDL